MLAGVKDGGGLLRSRTDASIWDEIKYCTLSNRCAKTKYEERKGWEGSEFAEVHRRLKFSPAAEADGGGAMRAAWGL